MADQSKQGCQENATLSPQAVRQITDKVYALLLQELKIENERRRLRNRSIRRR